MSLQYTDSAARMDIESDEDREGAWKQEEDSTMNKKTLFVFCLLCAGIAPAHDIQDPKDFAPSQFDSEIEKFAILPCLYANYETVYQLSKAAGIPAMSYKEYLTDPTLDVTHHVEHWYASIRPQLEGLNKTERLMIYGMERNGCFVRVTLPLPTPRPPARRPKP